GRFAVPAGDHSAPALANGPMNIDQWLRARPGEAGDTVLSVEDVTKVFALTPGLFGRGQHRLTAVDNVSFKIERGEAFGLVGESGSGKSTLAHIVAGLTAPSSGQVVFGGHALTRGAHEAEIRVFRRGLQMVFQDPFSSLNRRMRAGDAVAEPILMAKAADRRATRKIVASLFERVGLPPESVDRYPHAFSGGQRQRIALARALAGRPRLLICDEPTSALDVSIQAALLNLLMDLKDDLGLSLLFISHDLPVVRQISERVGVLCRGRLVETGQTDTIFDQPQDPYTTRLIDELPHRRGAHRPPPNHQTDDAPHLKSHAFSTGQTNPT
ncbi:MAG: ATP-binding cassette domain-containing protein, partial [Pseudomonadota bacterium]